MFELYEITSLVTCFGEPGEADQQLGDQLDNLLDGSEQSRIFQLEPKQAEQAAGVMLTGKELASLRERLEERLASEGYEDGEHPDDDILHILLPLQEKLQSCNLETIYRVV
ncbi:MAG: hypothetical protein ACJ8BW_15740 [Ktedonobacteraceae bacterium]